MSKLEASVDAASNLELNCVKKSDKIFHHQQSCDDNYTMTKDVHGEINEETKMKDSMVESSQVTKVGDEVLSEAENLADQNKQGHSLWFWSRSTTVNEVRSNLVDCPASTVDDVDGNVSAEQEIDKSKQIQIYGAEQNSTVNSTQNNTVDSTRLQSPIDNTATVNESNNLPLQLGKPSEQPETRTWLSLLFPFSSNKQEVTETTPLINKLEQLQQESTPAPAAGWFSWWSKPIEQEEEEEDFDGRKQHLRECRSKVESCVDNISYAYKFSLGNHFRSRLLDLAVFDTPTATSPVRFNGKNYPLTPKEVQEKIIQVNNYKKYDNGSIQQRANIILPDIDRNFRIITLQTKCRLFFEGYLSQINSPVHLYKVKPKQVLINKKSTKKIVIVGVHSFLPTKIVRNFVGQSSGNGLTLVKEATKAIKFWLKELSIDDYDIQTIALEGEGLITDRVEQSLKLLQNWHDVLLNSDFVFFVSYSHGTPIAINIMSQLVEKLGNKRYGLLSLNGIMEGVFTNLESKLFNRGYTSYENQVISEFIDLRRPETELSLQLMQSLVTLVKYNVKITFAGSISDQFIPLNSSLCNQFHHPNFYRLMYVDKDHDIPDFIVSLFEIIIIMKNKGVYNDHNLLRDLNSYCQGSNSMLGGHGKILYDSNVYLMGIKHSLETTDITNQYPMDIHYDFPTNNLYMLPWNIRGLLQELMKLKNIHNLRLIGQLKQDFKDWEPNTRAWRDIKFAFEAFDDMNLDDLMI